MLNRLPWDLIYQEWWGEYPPEERTKYVPRRFGKLAPGDRVWKPWLHGTNSQPSILPRV